MKTWSEDHPSIPPDKKGAMLGNFIRRGHRMRSNKERYFNLRNIFLIPSQAAWWSLLQVRELINASTEDMVMSKRR
jgi:hypothetical protein